MPVFLTGATGYVGGRLLEELLATGREVRALSRDASKLDGLGVEVVEGDVREDLTDALARVDVAYYLVHSLGTDDFGSADRDAAVAFARSAAAAGVGRVVYLGGIGRGELSPHLASRQEVGAILRDAVPTIELRASVVIGEGSVSYDAFTTLASLPLSVLPDWIDTPSQPIAVADVVAYLVEAAELQTEESRVYEIGGADRVPYRAILDAVGGRSVAVPAPELVATVATMLKPLQPERTRVVSDLLDSLRIDTSVHDDSALRHFSVRPVGLADAVEAASE